MYSKRLLTRLLLGAGMLAFVAGAEASASAYGEGGDFTLKGPDGPVSLHELRGKVVLIFFGYTSCPDVCPISLARINACFSEMTDDELERVRALFITLDPERDTLDKLEKYTGYFHPNIIGLRDDVEGIDSVTAMYGVEYSKNAMPESALGYSISHPTDILILDRDGMIVDAVPHNTPPTELLARIRDLLDASD